MIEENKPVWKRVCLKLEGQPNRQHYCFSVTLLDGTFETLVGWHLSWEIDRSVIARKNKISKEKTLL